MMLLKDKSTLRLFSFLTTILLFSSWIGYYRYTIDIQESTIHILRNIIVLVSILISCLAFFCLAMKNKADLYFLGLGFIGATLIYFLQILNPSSDVSLLFAFPYQYGILDFFLSTSLVMCAFNWGKKLKAHRYLKLTILMLGLLWAVSMITQVVSQKINLSSQQLFFGYATILYGIAFARIFLKYEWEEKNYVYFLTLGLLILLLKQGLSHLSIPIFFLEVTSLFGYGMIFSALIIRIYQALTHVDRRAEELTYMKIILEQHAKELLHYSQDLERIVEDRNKKLQSSQEQLVHSDKLASLGQVAAGIAHEIKNPLNFIINFSALCARSLAQLQMTLQSQKGLINSFVYDEMEKNVSTLIQNALKIQEHGKKTEMIIKTMLMHAGAKEVPPQPSDINKLLNEGFNLVYHGMKAIHSNLHIHFINNVDPSIGLVELIQQDVMRVFLNIFNNAFYSTYQKYQHRRVKDFIPTLEIKTKDLGDLVEISIKDNGEGISPEALNKLFSPFFTTKPPGEGTGLGLSISYDIVVNKHHGQIWAKSEPGEYAEFVIRLPKKFAFKKEEQLLVAAAE